MTSSFEDIAPRPRAIVIAGPIAGFDAVARPIDPFPWDVPGRATGVEKAGER